MSDDAAPARPADPHSLLVANPAGRVFCVVLLVVLGVWIVAPNMPASPIRNRVDSLWQPATNIGLIQDWSVFSPNPRAESIDLYALVEYEDGSAVRWDVPRGDPIVGAYFTYRWHKWQDRVRLDVRSDLWPTTGEWIARQHERDGELPATVRLVRRWRVHEPLTASGVVDSAWMEFEFYEWSRDDDG